MLVLAGISMVVTTMYVYMVPFLYHTQNPLIFALYFIYGNYLFVMICFNYFCGVYTSPGAAPKVSQALSMPEDALSWTGYQKS